MQRLTARFLIVFLLVGILVPGALALAGGPLSSCCTQAMQSHACCMRKGHSQSSQRAEISAQDCSSHCGCNGAVTGHSIGLRDLTDSQFIPVSAKLVTSAYSTETS